MRYAPHAPHGTAETRIGNARIAKVLVAATAVVSLAAMLVAMAAL